jgi:glutamate-ammonia-ligase adenylyltransferase
MLPAVRDAKALAAAILPGGVEAIRHGYASDPRFSDERAVDLATLLECAYPAVGPALRAHPEDVTALVRGARNARDLRAYKKLAVAAAFDFKDPARVRAGLRRFAAREKLRIMLRELEGASGIDVDVTARELSDLAEVCIDVALGEAMVWAEARFGIPRRGEGGPSAPRVGFVVIGMGKLGGRELNAGSDIDLLLFYETDDGVVDKDDRATEVTVHEYFTRVAQRLTSTLDEPTEHGIVFRVDLRLRPEGSRGPLVNALAAAERYYESWGRTWERVAMVRARPVAGDLALGDEILKALGPFVWRRVVNPQVADEMADLTRRARAEIGESEARRDLKLGPGGIREAEFFVQSLQLIWGGRQPSLRSTNTIDALRRLRAQGLVTEREAREVADGYLALRRLEHRVQFATGLQTHAIPHDRELLARLARSLGFTGAPALEKDLERTRRRISARFLSLGSNASSQLEASIEPIARLQAALDAGSEAEVAALLPETFGNAASPDLARHLIALSRPPDAPFGAVTRDHHPELASSLVDALSGAADPEQATRLLATLFARVPTKGLYVRAMASDPLATRRLTGLFGASAFLGDAAVAHPDLIDRLLSSRRVPDADSAAGTVQSEVAALVAPEADVFVGALRRAKRVVTMEVGLADLAGELTTRQCTSTLSALADAICVQATQFAMRERGQDGGLTVIAMGKLGGREIGYGSDLDLVFVYESEEPDEQERAIRVAQRVLRLLEVPHWEGPGYALDTRLRPSGNQGLLVVSLDAFVRYQTTQAAAWERQSLIKARAAAGDMALGARVIAVAEEAAYTRGAPSPSEIHRLRTRMERELGGERRAKGRARYEMKLGRGGLVDVEFAVQYMQMTHGQDPRVRTADTESAIGALEACGYMDSTLATSLRDGYRFLRQLEQRARVHHGTNSALIEEGAPGLTLLARRMGMRDSPRGAAAELLLARYVEVTEEIRAAYLRLLGLPDDAQGPTAVT